MSLSLNGHQTGIGIIPLGVIGGNVSNRVACETLDAKCGVCGAHWAIWVDEDESGDWHFTLDCLGDDGQRFIVHSDDLTEAVCELAK